MRRLPFALAPSLAHNSGRDPGRRECPIRSAENTTAGHSVTGLPGGRDRPCAAGTPLSFPWNRLIGPTTRRTP